MRDFQANDRVIGSELRSALVDAPERATYVVTDTNPTAPTDLEVGCEEGTVVIDGDEVSVSAQTESVSDISGEVTETAYRYHTLSVDDTGDLVVRSSDVGEFDAGDADAEPITQVAEPSHETGEVFLGTAFQVEGAIERVFDGRYVLDGVPNSVITQGEGSGLTAEFVEPQGEGSGLDADTLRGETKDDIVPQGVIVMWSGAITEIPDDWTLCDGTDGAPDLTDRFVVGAGGGYDVDETGGSDEVQLTESELPEHSHTRAGSQLSGSGSNAFQTGIESTDPNLRSTEWLGDTGGDEPHENRPPYYALAYIMKI